MILVPLLHPLPSSPIDSIILVSKVVSCSGVKFSSFLRLCKFSKKTEKRYKSMNFGDMLNVVTTLEIEVMLLSMG